MIVLLPDYSVRFVLEVCWRAPSESDEPPNYMVS